MSAGSTTPLTYRIPGRHDAAGTTVVAVLTDGPTDLPVVTHAIALAARTGGLLIAAAAVRGSGFSVNPRLHRVRAQRITTEAAAITGRVTPALHAAGIAHLRATLVLPARHDPGQPPPADLVRRLADRHHAALVVTAAPLSGITADGRMLLVRDGEQQDMTLTAAGGTAATRVD